MRSRGESGFAGVCVALGSMPGPHRRLLLAHTVSSLLTVTLGAKLADACPGWGTCREIREWWSWAGQLSVAEFQRLERPTSKHHRTGGPGFPRRCGTQLGPC